MVWAMIGLGSGLQVGILAAGEEVGTGLGDSGELTVTEDAGLGVVGQQTLDEMPEGCLLGFGTGVGGMAVGQEASFVADADAVGVVALGMGSHQVLMAGLVGLAVAGDIVVVAGVTEALAVAGDERGDREGTVTSRGAAVDDDHGDVSHGMFFLLWLTYAALHAEAAKDGCEDGDDKLDDGFDF